MSNAKVRYRRRRRAKRNNTYVLQFGTNFSIWHIPKPVRLEP